MDNLDPKPNTYSSPNPAAATDTALLADQVDSLRQLVISVLVLLVVLSGTFNIYLWRQVKYGRADLANARPQATELVSAYERVSQPAMKDFATRLVQYATAHPDDQAFAAIIKKYGLSGFLSSSNTAAVKPITAAPVPAATPAQPAKK